MKKHLNFPLVLRFVFSLSLALLFPSASGSQSAERSPSQTPQSSSPNPNSALRIPNSAMLPGQSATLLPDGRWLLMGGEGSKGPVETASVLDPKTQASTPLFDRLLYPRAYHTATLLPDGTVLILGGVNAFGQVVDRVELFSLEKQRLESLPFTGLTSRAHHTATLLTDGRVLIAGGISERGELISDAELWDPRAPQSTLRIPHLIPRHRHSATLLPDGAVRLWGGADQNGLRNAECGVRNSDCGTKLENGELFDPVTQKFTLLDQLPPPPQSSDIESPQLMASLPKEGATNVLTDTRIALHFSEPLRVETVNGDTVKLTALDLESSTPQSPFRTPQSTTPHSIKVLPAEEGMLAFITPTAPLLEGVTYTLSLSGLTDRAGLPLADTTVTFTIANASGSGRSEEDEWMPDFENLSHWKTGRGPSHWQSLPPLQASPGVTALAGQVLKLNGHPLANVTLEIEGRSARTDSTGRFLLTLVPPGQRMLVIDGKTANRPGKTYGFFEVGLNVAEGRTNALPYTIWMPVIDTAHAVTIPSPTTTEMTVTTPRIPGLKLIIPPQTVIRGRDGQVVRSISITPVPVDRPPFPLPEGVEFPVYFTLQPGGAHVETLAEGVPHGIRVIYPTYKKIPPSARADFWNYEPDKMGWFQYGQGTATRDGMEIVPDLGVAIYKFTASSYYGPPPPHLGGGTPPAFGPASDNTNGTDGDPVDLGTGLFVLDKTDLVLPDVIPIALTRTYRPGDSISRPFGIGATHPYQIFLVGDTTSYSYAELILPDGGRVRHSRISAGTGYADAVFEHTASPGRFYKSQIRWNGSGWNLTLKDGTVYVFGDSAPLQSIRDRFGNQITMTRTSGQTGNITKITSPNGRWVDFTYDAGNRITQAKDNIGCVVTYAYDAGGRLWKVTDPNGGITEYTYDASHRMLTIKDAKGITFLTNTYDANGRVINQTQADLTTYQFAYTVDASGKITQTDVTDPRGNIRRVTFNTNGYTLADTRAVGTPIQQALTFERQAGTNLILSVTDPLGRKTSYAYDTMGRVTSVTRLSGTLEAVTTTFTYEPTFNQVASITDPLNHATAFTYDAKGNVIAVTNPLGNQTNLAYNLAGQPISLTDPLGKITQFTYDFGDLTGVTDPVGNSTTRFIDSAGRLLSMTNPLGQLMRYDYNPLNLLTRVTDPLGGITSFSYDANGNLLSVTDARNGVTSYTYDSMDRLSSRKDPLLLSESYLYDAGGNPTKFTDRKSQATSSTYDALNRRTGTTYADLSTTTYTYDAGNRLTQIVDSISGTITLAYDNLDRLTQETTPQGSVSYTYDAAGRRTSMTVAGQPTVNYTYDNANRLTQITQGTSTVAFVYDAAGRRTSLTFPNGVVAEYGYDAASRLTAIAYKKGITVLGDLTYTYDAAGNRTKVGGTWARTGLPSPLASATYNAANQMITFGSRSLTYDANGNLTNDGTTSFSWDARNRLASTTATGTSGSFQYDPLGRRVNKTINGTSTSFFYDGQNPVQELAGTSPTANILAGLGIDEFITRTDSTGTRSLLTDALGSSLALADNAGTMLTEYTYDPFGRTTVTGTALANSFQYTGRENDGTGLLYYRARYYNPTLQRFISEDPIGFAAGQINFYAYVGNNPVNWMDPYGLAKGDWWDLRTHGPDLEGARRIAHEVLLETQQRFPNSPLHNDTADAWRHARWSERMANELGWGTAAIAGYGHELENLYDQWEKDEDFRWDETLMDLHNNREGRSGRNVDDLLNEGRLRTINPPMGGRKDAEVYY